MNNTYRNEPQTAPNSHADRQYHSPRSHEQQHTRRTKAIDMRFHWLQCSKAQHQFRFFWHPGPTNRADYWTKHHCAAHHIAKCPEILTPKIVLEALRAAEKNTEILNPKIVLEALRASVKRTPDLQILSQPSIKPSQFAPAAAAA